MPKTTVAQKNAEAIRKLSAEVGQLRLVVEQMMAKLTAQTEAEKKEDGGWFFLSK